MRHTPRRVIAPLVLLAALLAAFALAAGPAGCSSPGPTTTGAPPSTGTPPSSGAAGTAAPSTTTSSTRASDTSATVAASTGTSAGGDTISTSADRVAKLTLVAPAGPLAIPMAYLAVNNKLADVADQTELATWDDPQQLEAYVAGNQADFVTMPSDNAAIFYSKGIVLQLLDISVWNMTYLITSDAKAGSFADIKGESLAIPSQGSVPDLMFQKIVKSEGLDPQKDFKVRYASDPTQASQMLLSGQVQNAVLSEALATAVTLQTAKTAKPLHRAVGFDKAWNDALGGPDSPIAGTVATASVLDKPRVIEAFEQQYKAAVQWVLDNPEDAGKLAATQVPQLGVTAAVMTESLESMTWRFTSAVDARPAFEAFYQDLSEISPQVIGGRLPDDAFYFNYTP